MLSLKVPKRIVELNFKFKPPWTIITTQRAISVVKLGFSSKRPWSSKTTLSTGFEL